MKGQRVRVLPNIYQYRDGRYEAIVSAKGRRAPSHFFDKGTAHTTMLAWVKASRRRLVDEAATLPAARRQGKTFDQLAPAFFAQLAGPTAAADCSHFRAWLNAEVDGRRVGDLEPAALTTARIDTILASWRKASASARVVRVEGYGSVKTHERAAPITSARDKRGILTLRHRCRVLTKFYRSLAGKRSASTPVDEAAVPKRPKRGIPITVAAEVIVSTLRALAALDPITFARFAVVATTGQRPCQVGKAEPGDVDLARRTWIVRDAKGENPHVITLSDPAIAAWRAFVAAAAWGAFKTSAYGKVIHAAGWPNGIRPYNARHSISKAMLEAGITLDDVQANLGHTTPTTTMIYTPFVLSRKHTASEAMGGYLADAFGPQLAKGGGQ